MGFGLGLLGLLGFCLRLLGLLRSLQGIKEYSSPLWMGFSMGGGGGGGGDDDYDDDRHK